MPQSMTGYSFVKQKVGKRWISIEARSVNHKFAEINLRNPGRYACIEARVVECAKSFFFRGRIDLSIRDNHDNLEEENFLLDIDRLAFYYRQLAEAVQKLKLKSDIRLETLLNLPDVWIGEEEEDPASLWKAIEPLLKKCFTELNAMRKHEGLSIEKFLKSQVRAMIREHRLINKSLRENKSYHTDMLQKRIAKAISPQAVDQSRLAQELVLIVDRTDISEEMQRLKQHIDHFQLILKGEEAMGRKLDFLLQEMHREVNTMSSKAQSAYISQRVVECKHILEKMREQVQNIE